MANLILKPINNKTKKKAIFLKNKLFSLSLKIINSNQTYIITPAIPNLRKTFAGDS